MSKKWTIVIYLFALIATSFAQETTSQVRILDRVRMRDSFGVQARILATLEPGTIGTYLAKQETEKDPVHSVFAWIKINADEKIGWVYGAYVSLEDPRMNVGIYRISNANEISMLISGKRFFVGMAQEEAMQLLGKHDKEEMDSNAAVLTCTYSKKELIIEYDTYRKCVKSIRISSPSITLASQLQVGISIDNMVISNSSEVYESENLVYIPSVFAPTYNKWYVPTISIEYNEKRLISEIFISLNVE